MRERGGMSTTPQAFRKVTVKLHTCVICNAKFRPRRADARYCSARCRQKAQRARDNSGDMGTLDHRIEAARLEYWSLIAQKAHALGRSRSQILSASEAQYVDLDGHVWVGGVLGQAGGWRCAGKIVQSRAGWERWGNEAAGPPWASPGLNFRTLYERAILGALAVTTRNAPKKKAA